MSYVFSTAERRMFETAQRILGGSPGELLRSRLADGVFGNSNPGPASAEQRWGRVDEFFLRRAGAAELGMLPDFLEDGCVPGEPAPSANILRSLRTVLLSRGHPGLDLQLRAGLHRLGRATADLDASSLVRITSNLPVAWERCAKAAWFRLSRLEECRASASTLRRILASGGET